MRFEIVITNEDGYQWFAGYVTAATAADAAALYVGRNPLGDAIACNAYPAE